MVNFDASSRDTADLHAEFVDAKSFRFIVKGKPPLSVQCQSVCPQSSKSFETAARFQMSH
jgi:hypothetical protein